MRGIASDILLNLIRCFFFFLQITSSAESEAKLNNGLVKGHAYSITGLEEVRCKQSITAGAF